MCVRVHYINNYNSFTTENFHIYIYIYFFTKSPIRQYQSRYQASVQCN